MSEAISSENAEGCAPQQPRCWAPPRHLLQHNHHNTLGSHEAAGTSLLNGKQGIKGKKEQATELDKPVGELSYALLHQTASPVSRAAHEPPSKCCIRAHTTSPVGTRWARHGMNMSCLEDSKLSALQH